MANRIRLVNLGQFSEQVKKAVGRQVVPIILTEAIQQSIPDIKRAIQDSFRRTEAAQALLSSIGAGETKDLGAILGLDAEMSVLAYDSIIDAIEDALEIDFAGINYEGKRFAAGNKSFTNVQKVGILIRVPKLRDAVMSGRFTEYVSETTISSTVIPFLKWLIEGAYLDDVQLRYQFYDSPTPSRTGRALMVLGDGWTLEPEDFAQTGKNFLHDIVNDPNLKEEITGIFVNNIQIATNNLAGANIVIKGV